MTVGEKLSGFPLKAATVVDILDAHVETWDFHALVN